MRQIGNRSFESSGIAIFEPLEGRRLFAAATHTQVLASTSTPTLGQDVVFTATVTPNVPGTGTATGFVRFREGLVFLGKVSLGTDGKASLTLYNLFTGGHKVVARYVGNGRLSASVSSAFVSVMEGATQVRSDGLEVSVITPGVGTATAANNKSLQVNYTGYLADGTKFDSSLNPGRSPFNFVLGTGAVIQGWDEGLLGMKAGETRVLIVPPSLAYGSHSTAGVPVNSTLFFVIRLLSFQDSTDPILLATGSNLMPLKSGANPSAQNGTDFGAVTVGSSSATTTIVLNSGNNASLMFTQTPFAALTGADAGLFTFSQPVFGGNNDFIVTVSFNPVAKGVRRARIDLFTNDAVHPTFHIRLVGTGI